MVQFSLVNDAGVTVCRLTLAPASTVQQLLLQLFIAKPEMRTVARVLRNDARGTVYQIEVAAVDYGDRTELHNTSTLLQVGLTAVDAVAETVVVSHHTNLPRAPSTVTTTANNAAARTGAPDPVAARILELFGGGSPSPIQPVSGNSSAEATGGLSTTGMTALSGARPSFVSPPDVAGVDHHGSANSLSFVDPDLMDEQQAERQRRLYAYIQQRQIDENFANAIEYTPEAFAPVTMLYIPCMINRVPLKAFVDSGAQMSIMNKKTAETCGLMRLVDTRMRGIAMGVGQQEIIGRIHMTPVNLFGMHIPFSFSVLAAQNIDVIIGLDQLKRHQMVIDLKDNCLRIEQVCVPFLPESEIPKISRVPVANEERGEEGRTVSAGAEATAQVPSQPPLRTAPPSHQQQQRSLLPPVLSPAPAATAATTTRLPAIAPSAAPNSGGNTNNSAPPLPIVMPAPLRTPSTSTTASPVANVVASPTVPTNEANRQMRVRSFMDFTGMRDAVRARALLETVEWDPDAAAALYFDDGP